MSYKSFENINTNSVGKHKSEEFQEPFFKNAGSSILLLVGSADGLQRHIENSILNGFDQIYIYERVKEVYDTLVDKANQLYSNNPFIRIHIHKEDALNHDFQEHPIDVVDFDSCDCLETAFKETEGKKNISTLFGFKIPIVSMTFSLRSPSVEYLVSQRILLELPANTKTKDVILAKLKKEFQGYEFSSMSYLGKGWAPGNRGGAPMCTIIGKYAK